MRYKVRPGTWSHPFWSHGTSAIGGVSHNSSDLVIEGAKSQKNLLQLSRTAKNVWLLTATPFPQGNTSAYANHELLGFCRLRLDVEVTYNLHSSHPFEIIKRKLYIRSPKHVADDAVSASKTVTRETVDVRATELESKFYQLEKEDIVSSDPFDAQVRV